MFERCSKGEKEGDRFLNPEQDLETSRYILSFKNSSVLSLAIIIPWILFLFSFALLIVQPWSHPSERGCIRLLNLYSPLIEAGAVEYYEADFDNDFGHKSIYRGPPTVDLELAWDRLWSRGAQMEIPADQVHKLKRHPSSLVHFDNDPSRGYLALSEVSHQLHCLNLIRQYTWREYYRNHTDIFTGGTLRVDLNISDEHSIGDRMHVDHCFETLRLVLMCHSDVTPALLIKDESKPRGKRADFNALHKCRNFDKIMDFQEAN